MNRETSMENWTNGVKLTKQSQDTYQIRFTNPQAHDGFLKAVKDTRGPIGELFSGLDGIGRDDASQPTVRT